MGYVFNYKDAVAYEKWFNSQNNKAASILENSLILEMLKPMHGRTLLDIGCGTGYRLSPFLEKGLEITGIDPSIYMLDIAREKYKNKITFHRGAGESLPFDDNSFHYASLVTTLEYVEDPLKVIEESCRVAKDKVFIGIYNSYSIKCLERRIRAMFIESIYSHAKYYSIWNIINIVKKVIGDVPLGWGTICRLPQWLNKVVPTNIESVIIRRFPFGSFAGIIITPVPRFSTSPLALTYNTRPVAMPNIQPIKSSDKGGSI
jgi:ubiquinone/menaquinone biosynthesis C-methylase UbiE